MMATGGSFQQKQLHFSTREMSDSIPPSIWLAKFSKRPRDENSHVQLELNKDALSLLKTISQQKPVAVLSICGPYRSGKSFFLSRMLHTNDAFTVSEKMKPCTEGIWMSTTVLECNDFVVVLLDTEGTDAAQASEQFSATDVTKLLVLTTLLSSYLVYNTTGAVKQTHLNEMSCFSHIAESILLREGYSTNDHLHEQQLQCCFPQFLWLLRDNRLKPEIDDKPVSVTEYVKREILVQSKQQGAQNDRNEIVRTILALFPNIECRQTPPPGEPLNEDSTFLDAIDSVASFLLSNIEPKQNFDHQMPINGSVLANLAEQYVYALNEPGATPNLELSWLEAVKKHLVEQCAAKVTEYSQEMRQKLSSRLPIEEGNLSNLHATQEPNTLAGIHQEVFTPKLTEIQTKLAHFLPAMLTKETTEELIASHFQRKIIPVQEQDGTMTRGELSYFVDENYKLSKKFCEETLNRLLMDQGDVQLQKLKKNYYQKAVGPAKEEVYSKGTKDISGPPLNVKTKSKTFRKVKITWNQPIINPNAVKQYEVHISKDQSSRSCNWEKYITSVTETEIKVKPNTKYRLQVRGVNELKNGQFSEMTTFQSSSGRPDRPQRPVLKFDSPTKATFVIQRLPKEKENGSPVTDVIVETQSCVQSGSEWEVIHTENMSMSSVSSALKKMIPNATDGHGPYTFQVDLTKHKASQSKEEDFVYQVRLKNKAGESEPSECILISTKEMCPDKVCSPLPNIEARTVGLRWKHPKYYPLSAQHFDVRCKKDGESAYVEERRYEECAAEFKGLQPNAKYIFEIRGANEKCMGEWYSIPVKTKPDCPNAPRKPSIEIESHNQAKLIVKKATKKEENGKPVTKVIIELKPALNHGEWTRVACCQKVKSSDTKAATMYTFNLHLDSATTNSTPCYRVLMENEIGLSQPSEEAHVPVKELKPGPIIFDEEKCFCKPSSITLKWELPYNPAAVSGYQILVQETSDSEGNWKTFTPPVHSSTEYNIPHLKPYTMYRVRICAVNWRILGEFSEITKRTSAAPPLKPRIQSLVMHESDPAKAIIRFYKLTKEDERGSPVDSVELQWSDDTNTWNLILKWKSSEFGKNLIINKEFELPEGVTKANQAKCTHYRIIMCSGKIQSEPSDPQVIESAELRPGSIENLRIINTGVHSVTISWDTPLLNSERIKKYVIDCYENDGGAQIRYHEIKSDCKTFEIKSLASGKTFSFEVYAKTEKCIGQQRRVVATTVEIIFSAPQNIRAEFKQREAVKIRWKKPIDTLYPSESPAYYKVQVKKVEFTRLTRGMSTVIRKLGSSEEYTVEVTSINENGKFNDKSTASEVIKTTMSNWKRGVGAAVAVLPTLGIGSAVLVERTKAADDKDMIDTDEEYDDRNGEQVDQQGAGVNNVDDNEADAHDHAAGHNQPMVQIIRS